MTCYCGAEKPASQCCEPLLQRKSQAQSPEQLMRSRYSAFSVKNIDYLYDTLDPQARDQFDLKANTDWAEKSRFTKLEILNSSAEGNKGLVEFKAHYQLEDGVEKIHHERAKFRKQGGIWYFREGKVF